jgi:hypothetical protein
MTTDLGHPPVRGKLSISLNLSKRPQGVSQLEATGAGGGTRLAAQIGNLEAKGHRFGDAWEQSNGSRYKRYRWVGWEQPHAPASPLPTDQPETYSANL